MSFRSWIKALQTVAGGKLSGQSRRQASRKRSASRFRLQLEYLEDRLAPASFTGCPLASPSKKRRGLWTVSLWAPISPKTPKPSLSLLYAIPSTSLTSRRAERGTLTTCKRNRSGSSIILSGMPK